ncbi:sialate O-acetylesterase [uncultured Fibrella sp.]|uniref:sialate O-acetylesterase n=1 Tax=uncultured Fibrella sp. TaxID=1284596 RepID=UPI0035CA4D77
MPYLTLRNTLNLHGSLFGTRGLLWHQGETDADPTRNASDRTTNKQDYKDRLQQVISQTRSDFNGNLSWIIAQATFTNYGNITQSIRDAQLEKGQEGDKNEGPDTDYQPNGQSTTDIYRSDGTHFNETTNSGLTYLATYEWSGKVNAPSPAGFNRISANPVPSLSISKNGSNRTLSVSPISGAQEYRWGTDINNPSQQGANLTTITVSAYSGSYRCYIKDATGNWRISPKADLGCPSCRVGVEEAANEDPYGLALTTYPNPFAKDLTIEFNVPEARSDVRLELVDIEGKVIRTVATGIYDKGHWKYPLSNLNIPTNRVYFCRLKVGDLFVTRKLLPID